jgi:hypothetical protein
MTESDERDTEILGRLPATVRTRVPVVSPAEKPKRKRLHQVSNEAAKAISRTGPKNANPKDCGCEHESLLAMKAVEWLPTYCQPGRALHGMKCFNEECESGVVSPNWPKQYESRGHAYCCQEILSMRGNGYSCKFLACIPCGMALMENIYRVQGKTAAGDPADDPENKNVVLPELQ